jgi:acyl carrier protein
MTDKEIIKKIQPVFREVFKDSGLEVARELSAPDVPQWTSLTNTVMIHEVEKVFGIRFGFRDIVGLNNVGDLIDLVRKKITE